MDNREYPWSREALASPWLRRLGALVIRPQPLVPRGELWVSSVDFQAIRDDEPIEPPPFPDVNAGHV